MVTVNIDMATSPSTNGPSRGGLERRWFLDDSKWGHGQFCWRLSRLWERLDRRGDGRGFRLCLDSDDFYAGDSGSGTLSITNGGSVGSGDGYIGCASGSEARRSPWMCRLDLDHLLRLCRQ